MRPCGRRSVRPHAARPAVRDAKPMIPNDFIQTLLGPRRHRRRRRPLRPAEEGRRQLRRLLPVPQREDAVVHGEPDQAVLSLLRLRRARHGDRLPDGVRRASRFPRRSRSSRATPGSRCRAIERAGDKRAARGRRRPARRCCSTAAQVLPRAAEGRAARDRLPQGARPDRRDRRALRHRLRAGRLADLAAAFPDYDDPALEAAGLVDQRRRRQALRPLPRPRHVPDPRQPRPRDRLRRPRARTAASPSTSTRRKRRCSRRAASSTACSRRATRSATPAGCVVVEGYMDVVALAQHGVEYAVATLGTATTPVHVQKLFRLTDDGRVLLRRRRRRPQGGVARAGERAAGAAPTARTRSSCSCPTARIPDDFVRKRGKAAFEQRARERRAAVRVPAAPSWRAQHPPTSAEGRAALVAAARPLLAQIDAPVLARDPAPAAGRACPACPRTSSQRCCGRARRRRSAGPNARPTRRAERRGAGARRAPSLARELIQALLLQPDRRAASRCRSPRDGTPEGAALDRARRRCARAPARR